MDSASCDDQDWSAMTSAELLSSMGTDARKWARAFMTISKDHPGLPSDEGTMLGWFANAIMAGWDAHARRTAVCGICGTDLVRAAPRAGGGDLWEPHECKEPIEIMEEWRNAHEVRVADVDFDTPTGNNLVDERKGYGLTPLNTAKENKA